MLQSPCWATSCSAERVDVCGQGALQSEWAALQNMHHRNLQIAEIVTRNLRARQK